MIEERKMVLLKMQKNEITEHLIYKTLAAKIRDKANRKIITQIAADELKHYGKLKALTKTDVKPKMSKVRFYYIVSRVFGLSFGLKLMEKGEEIAVRSYGALAKETRALKSLSLDEQKHEKVLLDVLSEERLEYAGSIVLGLNDALVELTGALAGLTFALQSSKLVALAGLVTGFAASLSMAASGYLSFKEESDQNEKKNPLKAALYTGVTYISTVLLLIIPYFTPLHPFIALAVTVAIALVIIFLYTFYISTAKGLPFFGRFAEMAVISLVIAGISFFAGLGLKVFLGVDV